MTEIGCVQGARRIFSNAREPQDSEGKIVMQDRPPVSGDATFPQRCDFLGAKSEGPEHFCRVGTGKRRPPKLRDRRASSPIPCGQKQ
jgi:hypothetical protein